ncbi:lanthionine synthetase C family protein [Spirosoma montaniterrae]|nr:lanthionine synthetase C family protein [Spirosoma montaniterrae]
MQTDLLTSLDTARFLHQLVDNHEDLLTRDDSPALYVGTGGSMLLYAHLFVATGDNRYAHSLYSLLDKAVTYLRERVMDTSLVGGFTGVGWLLQHLATLNLIDEDADTFTHLDGLVSQSVELDIRMRYYELMNGLVGKGLYCLSRGGVMDDTLRRVVEGLVQTADHRPEGLTWRYYGQAEERYSLGLSHGIPGVIAFLSRLLTRSFMPHIVRPLLIDTIRWLLSQENQAGQERHFPRFVPDRDPSRLGWCYGDMGVAIALWPAAQALNDDVLRQKAIQIMLTAAQCSVDQSGISMHPRWVDGAFCHGVAGIAHLFNRFYRATGDCRFDDAARHWLQLLLQSAACDSAGPYSTFRTLIHVNNAYDEQDRPIIEWKTLPTLLDGLSGIGLVLLSFAYPDVTDWDAPFLTDVHR